MAEKLPFEPTGQEEIIATVEVLEQDARTSALVEVNPTVDPRVLKLLEEAEGLKTEALALVVDSGPAETIATNSLVMITGLQKALEILRTGYTRPLASYTKFVNDSFKAFTEPLGVAEKVTKQKMIVFHREEEAKRQAQIDLNRQRQELADKEMQVDGELSRSVDLQPVDAPVNTHHVTNMGSATLKQTWKWNVADITKVPAEYMMIDAALVGKIVRAGLHEIPGLNIYPEDNLSVSAAKG